MKRKVYERKGMSVVAKPKKFFKTSTIKRKGNDHNLLMALKKNIFQHEKKFLDSNLGGTALYALAGTATITLISGIIQGTDENTRIGRQVNWKSLFIRGVVRSQNTTVGQGAIRTMLIIDQEVGQVAGAGTTFLITDFLNVDTLYSTNNLNNRKRFKIIMDEVVPLSGCTVSTGNPTSQEINRYTKLNTTSEFNQLVAGNITDYTKNAFYLVTHAIGLSVAAPISDLYIRLRFTDN